MSRSIIPSLSSFVGALLLLLLLLSLHVDPSSSARVSKLFWDRTTIILYNDIDASLTVHCRSKDDDLGSHVLQKGQTWQFSFKPNVFGSTLFWGSFEWSGQLHYFDVYKQSRDFRYKQIQWTVKTDGPCYTIHGDEYCHPWNS